MQWWLALYDSVNPNVSYIYWNVSYIIPFASSTNKPEAFLTGKCKRKHTIYTEIVIVHNVDMAQNDNGLLWSSLATISNSCSLNDRTNFSVLFRQDTFQCKLKWKNTIVVIIYSFGPHFVQLLAPCLFLNEVFSIIPQSMSSSITSHVSWPAWRSWRRNGSGRTIAHLATFQSVTRPACRTQR